MSNTAGPQGYERCKTYLALALGVMKLGSWEAKKQTGRDKGSAEEGAGHHRDRDWGLQRSAWGHELSGRGWPGLDSVKCVAGRSAFGRKPVARTLVGTLEIQKAFHQLDHSKALPPAVCPWAQLFHSLRLSFLICQLG